MHLIPKVIKDLKLYIVNTSLIIGFYLEIIFRYSAAIFLDGGWCIASRGVYFYMLLLNTIAGRSEYIHKRIYISTYWMQYYVYAQHHNL